MKQSLRSRLINVPLESFTWKSAFLQAVKHGVTRPRQCPLLQKKTTLRRCKMQVRRTKPGILSPIDTSEFTTLFRDAGRGKYEYHFRTPGFLQEVIQQELPCLWMEFSAPRGRPLCRNQRYILAFAHGPHLRSRVPTLHSDESLCLHLLRLYQR